MDKMQVSKIAAKWWANQVKRPKHRSGDETIDATKTIVAILAPVPTTKQMVEFETTLAKILFDRLENNETGWSELDPRRGSVLRAVGTDYHPDEILKKAAVESGISCDLFPIKTFMRLDPDSVRVSAGYGAPVVTLENIYADTKFEE